jgi:tRNA 2-thiouridine synthesizing protein A
MSIIKADFTLDTVGLYCPMPIIKTSKAIKKIQVGQVLEILADDDGIKTDMPSWCQATGNEFLGLKEEDGEYHVYIKRKH